MGEGHAAQKLIELERTNTAPGIVVYSYKILCCLHSHKAPCCYWVSALRLLEIYIRSARLWGFIEGSWLDTCGECIWLEIIRHSIKSGLTCPTRQAQHHNFLQLWKKKQFEPEFSFLDILTGLHCIPLDIYEAC